MPELSSPCGPGKMGLVKSEHCQSAKVFPTHLGDHQDSSGNKINLGPGSTPAGSHEGSFVFYDGSVHPAPRLQATYAGARMWNFGGRESKPVMVNKELVMPVSGTTLHAFSPDWAVPPGDLYALGTKAASKFGVVVIAVWYQCNDQEPSTTRATIGTSKGNREAAFMEPHGHFFLAIAPGNTDKLLGMIAYMDSVVFEIGSRFGDHNLKTSSRTSVQCSRKELIPFLPGDKEWRDRRIADGPKYGMEIYMPEFWTDLDYFAWNTEDRKFRSKDHAKEVFMHYYKVNSALLACAQNVESYLDVKPDSVYPNSQTGLGDIATRGGSYRLARWGGPLKWGDSGSYYDYVEHIWDQQATEAGPGSKSVQEQSADLEGTTWDIQELNAAIKEGVPGPISNKGVASGTYSAAAGSSSSSAALPV